MKISAYMLVYLSWRLGGRLAGDWVCGRPALQCSLTFRFPLIMLSLGNRFTSYSHTLLLRSSTFHKHASL